MKPRSKSIFRSRRKQIAQGLCTTTESVAAVCGKGKTSKDYIEDYSEDWFGFITD